MRQKTNSANFASRTLLELDKLLREGGVRPKAAMARDFMRSQSQTSLRLRAWASWAKTIVPRWLSTE